MKTERLLEAAKKRIGKMDATDGGMVAQPLDLALRTVMTAMEAGMDSGDWGCVADAFVMLGQIEFRYRPADMKEGGPYRNSFEL